MVTIMPQVLIDIVIAVFIVLIIQSALMRVSL